MSEHEIDELDEELRALLALERVTEALPAAAATRLRSRVEATLGITAPVSGGDGGDGGDGGGSGGSPTTGGAGGRGAPLPPTPLAQSAGAAASGLPAWMAHPLAHLATLAVGGALGAVAHGQLAPPHTAPIAPSAVVVFAAPPPRVEPAAAVVESSSPLPTAAAPAPLATTSARTPSAPRAAPAVDPAAGRDTELGAERADLEIARTALGRAQPADALDALARHARRFPNGRLAEERESLWVQALVVAGDTKRAEARAEQFRRRFPNSLFLPAVESALHP